MDHNWKYIKHHRASYGRIFRCLSCKRFKLEVPISTEEILTHFRWVSDNIDNIDDWWDAEDKYMSCDEYIMKVVL
jgi:hypothetical protein